MTALLVAAGVGLIVLPGTLVRRWDRLRPSEWTRLNRASLWLGLWAVRAGLLLSAAPTVLRAAGIEHAAAACHELFGPVLPVLAVDGPEAARDFILSRPKPLALYAFSGDDGPIDTVVDGTSSGGVCINQTLMHLLPPDLPFGGVGDSGMGAYHGRAGFDVFSHHKSVLRKPTRPDLKLLYPPYKPLVEKLVRKLVR